MGRNPSLYLAVGIIAILAIGSLFVVQDSEADSSETMVIEQDGMVYELDPKYGYNRTAAVIGVADGFDSSDIEIPSTVTHEGHDYRVRSIADDAFRDQTGLVSVELPQSMTSIGDGAFAGCTSLVDINIPYMVTELRETFVGCTSLESIMLTGNYYTTDLYGTFEGCTSLRDVCIRWTANVWDDTFAGCESLVNIETYQIARFGDRSFMGCTSLESLDVRSGVYYIGESAFEGCTSLTSVDIVERENLTIGDRAFADCPSLSSVSIDEGVNILGDGVFSGCASLSAITFLDDSCEVGEGIFLGCGSISQVRIHNLEVLGQLDLGDDLMTLALGGGIADISGTMLPALANLRTLVLEDGVVSVGDGAFSGSPDLELIAIQGSIETMGASAFDVAGRCMVAGPDGCLEQAGVSDPRYGSLIVYDVSGRPDMADHRMYGWAEPGDRVVPETEDLEGCTVAVTVGEEDVLGGFTAPDGDVTVEISYDDGVHNVTYYDNNVMIAYYWAHVGDPVPVPEDPSMPPRDDYIYEFIGWDGLEPGDVVTGFLSYYSMYRMVMVDDSGAEVVRGAIELDDRLDYPLYLTEDVANGLLALCIENGVDEVSFSFSDGYSYGWMALGIDDLVKIGEEGLTICIQHNWDFHVDSIIVEGPQDLTVDVDLSGSQHWNTRVYSIDENGEAEEMYNTYVRHDGEFVRFTVSESGLYDARGDSDAPEIRSIVFFGTIVVLVVAAYIICWYAKRDEQA